MAEKSAFSNVHVVVYHDSENQYVGFDVFSSFEKALEQFDQRLKATRSDHPEDPDWIFTLTRDTKRHELYFLDKAGYEVFYRNEAIQGVDQKRKPLPRSEQVSYEMFKIHWMLEHGKTLEELIDHLEELREEEPEATIRKLFEMWELEAGFHGEIWPCFEEFLMDDYPIFVDEFEEE